MTDRATIGGAQGSGGTARIYQLVRIANTRARLQFSQINIVRVGSIVLRHQPTDRPTNAFMGGGRARQGQQARYRSSVRRTYGRTLTYELPHIRKPSCGRNQSYYVWTCLWPTSSSMVSSPRKRNSNCITVGPARPLGS